jgi:hypothetical protein
MDTYSMDTAINKMSQFVLYCKLHELGSIYKALRFRVENATTKEKLDLDCEINLIRSIEELHPGINSPSDDLV